MGVTAADFDYVSRLVSQRSAIVLADDKTYLVESRLAPLAKDLGLGGIDELVARLRQQRDQHLESKVVEAMTTNETSWFRDIHPFEALRTEVVPELIRRNAATKKLRIWSAASSTGQELYTIAMTLDTHFPELSGWQVELIGTDLSTEVVDKAREGRYSALEVNRGLPAAMLVRYFDRDGVRYRISDALRSRVHFEQMNLVEPWPVWLGRFDVVFMRNVLIYFDADVKRRILRHVGRLLSPGGSLFLGAAETTLGLLDDFVPVQVGRTSLYRLQEA